MAGWFKASQWHEMYCHDPAWGALSFCLLDLTQDLYSYEIDFPACFIIICFV